MLSKIASTKRRGRVEQEFVVGWKGWTDKRERYYAVEPQAFSVCRSVLFVFRSFTRGVTGGLVIISARFSRRYGVCERGNLPNKRQRGIDRGRISSRSRFPRNSGDVSGRNVLTITCADKDNYKGSSVTQRGDPKKREIFRLDVSGNAIDLSISVPPR